MNRRALMTLPAIVLVLTGIILVSAPSASGHGRRVPFQMSLTKDKPAKSIPDGKRFIITRVSVQGGEPLRDGWAPYSLITCTLSHGKGQLVRHFIYENEPQTKLYAEGFGRGTKVCRIEGDSFSDWWRITLSGELVTR